MRMRTVLAGVLVVLLAVLYLDYLNTLQLYHNYAANTTDFVLMTYNLRGSDIDDGRNRWQFRRQTMFDLIRKYNPLVFGTQEGGVAQVGEVAAKSGKYSPIMESVLVGTNRKYTHSYVCLLYDYERVEVKDSGHFWISETPSIPESRSWNTAHPRMASYGIFRLKSDPNFEFVVVNVHLDHVSREARLKGSKLVQEKINSMFGDKGIPIFILGDFNASPGHPPYHAIMEGGFEDAWEVCRANTSSCVIPYAASSTFHMYYGKIVHTLLAKLPLYAVFTHHGKALPFWGRYHIDWIMYKSNSKPIFPKMVVVPVEEHDPTAVGKDWTILAASDHYPLVAVFNIGK